MEQSTAPFLSYTARGTDPADRLVAAYWYLCKRGARKFVRGGLDRSDLEQVAAIGLIKASRRYDPSLETPFEAFAWMSILGELMHHVRDYEHPVRVPRRLMALERRISDASDALALRLEREPTDDEIAETLRVPAASVARVRRLRAGLRAVPIDDVHGVPARADDTLALEDRLELNRAFASLGTLERRIVGGVYLLGLSQTQLARTLGLPPKRVSRIHLGALARMRRAWPA
jgi:RNA polymerase sigma-B factor